MDIAAIVDDETRSVATKASIASPTPSSHPSGIAAHPGSSSGGSGWKGRAQKILLLKSKLKEARDEVAALRDRLGEDGGRLGDGDTATVFTRKTAHTVGTSATRRIDVDSVAKYELQVRMPRRDGQCSAKNRQAARIALVLLYGGVGRLRTFGLRACLGSVDGGGRRAGS